MSTVAVYFVATPLHYLAARRVALDHEQGSRQVLLWYKRVMDPIVRAADWDAAAYMPWPRFDPLPGRFGRHRRLRENIRQVAELVGRCDTLHLHSPVFDTEAINYFLKALPRTSGARRVRARIIPDGFGNTFRQQQSVPRHLAQYFRMLRTLVAPELRYTPFRGDRIGSDASFCDRIYVLPGLPHAYDQAKAVTLAPLVEDRRNAAATNRPRTALLLGQPLTGDRDATPANAQVIDEAVRRWLSQEGFERVLYKAHPRDPRRELMHPGDELLQLDIPIETWLSQNDVDAVVSVHSTGLLMAGQICAPHTRIVSIGLNRLAHTSQTAHEHVRGVLQSCRAEIVDA